MMLISVMLTAAIAGALQTVTGFGAGIFLVLTLSRFVDMAVASAVNSTICTGLTMVIAIRYRELIDLKLTALPIAVYAMVSMSIIRYIDRINLDTLEIALGIFLICVSVYFTFFSKRIKLRATTTTAIVCGGISGIFSGLFGLGGPPVGLYFTSVIDSHEKYLANTQFLFSVTNLFNTAMRISKGIYTADLIPITVAGMVAINIGRQVGVRIYKKMSAETLKMIIYVFVGVSGVIMLIRHLI